MSDGSIVFDTRIDKTNIDKEMAAISKKIDSINEKISQNSRKTSILVAQEIDRAAKELAQLDKQIATQSAKRRPDNEYLKKLKDQAWEVRSYMENLQNHGAAALEHSTSNEVVERYRQLKTELQQCYQNMANLKKSQIELQKSTTMTPTDDSGGGGILSKLGSLMNTIKSGLSNAFDKVKTSIGGAKEALSGFKSQSEMTGLSAKALTQSIFSLGNIFLGMAKRKLLSTIFGSVTSGLTALQNSTLSAGAGLRGLASAGAYAGNSIAAAIAPLAGMILPVFNAITNAIVSAMNALARFLALLGGKTTYTKAVKQNASVAGSAGKVAKEAKEAAKAVKEEERALASFDEINQLGLKNAEDAVTPEIETPGTGGGGGGGGGLAFVEEAIEPSEFMLELAERLQRIWGNLVAIAEALGEKWREAWEFNGNGEAILNSLKEILWDILDCIEHITEYTLDWVQNNLDLIPLVTGIRDVLDSLEPVVQLICDAIEWVWVNVVLPLSEWILESALPKFLETLATLLDTIKTAMEVLAPILERIFNDWIKPIAEDVGQAFLDFLDWVNEKLTELATWMTENQEQVESWTILILSFLAAILLVNAAITVGTALATVFGAVMAFLTSPIGLVVAAIGILIAILVSLAGGWDKAKTAAKNAINGIIGFVEKGFNGAIAGIESFLNWVIGGLNSLISMASGLGELLGFGSLGGIGSVKLGRIKIPRLATGTVIPPSAGEFAAILGDNNADTEIVSPLDTMKQAFLEAISESGGLGGSNVVIKFDGTMGELVRMLKPELDSETRRVGVKLVTE